MLAMFLLPAPTSMDVRGNTEMFPINGPHWSLFFEYIGSLLYALMLHRLSTKVLKLWVALAAVALLLMGLYGPDGSIAYGWSSEPRNFLGGALRMLYAYPMGLLMARVFRERQPKPIKGHMFLLCSLALIVLLGFPFLGSKDMETIYQLVCILSLFPTIVWFGARGMVSGWRQKVVSFLGRLSYPLYAIHFPFIYLYIAWVQKSGYTYIGHSHPWLAAAIALVASLLIATLCMLFYDEPLRMWLTRKLNSKS